VTTVTTVRRRRPEDGTATEHDSAGGFRRRLLDGLAASMADKGYQNTTIADVVRHARTSRRTFYEHFSSKDECFVALLTDANAEMIRKISATVDRTAPWASQVRQAIETWVACAESEPTIMVSWVRDVPSLGDAARRLHRDVVEAFVVMIQTFGDTEMWRAAGAGPVPRQLAIMLLGGLRLLTATTIENGGRISDFTETAIEASMALLGPRS
jgi:AcrR family transcriptional regulator